MPVKDRNPFGPNTVEEGKADVGVSDPFSKPTNVVKCAMCGEMNPEKLTSHNTPTQIIRGCKSCGNKWSCGNVGGLMPVEITEAEMMPPQAPDPAEDVPDDPRLSGTERWFD